MLFLATGIWGPYGTLGYGWSSEGISILGGFLRMSFDFSLGLLLIRIFKNKSHKEKGFCVFLACSTLLILLLSVPSIGKYNVYYEFICIAIFFPVLLMTSAKCVVSQGNKARAVTLLGNISYPLYAIHYPFIYLYIGIIFSGTGFLASHNELLLIICGAASLLSGYLSMRFYDIPVRKKLCAKDSPNRKAGR